MIEHELAVATRKKDLLPFAPGQRPVDTKKTLKWSWWSGGENTSTIEVFTNRLLWGRFKIQGLWKTATLSLTMKGCLDVIKRFWRCLCSILQKSFKKIIKTRINDRTWGVGSEVTDRSVLSDELANFCERYPIYKVKTMEDTLKTTRIQTAGQGHIKTFF